jgi:hypothetical protein
MDFLPPSAVSEATSLLTIIADPEKHRKALEDIAAKSKIGAQLFADAQAAQKKSEEDRATAEVALAEAKAITAGHAQAALTHETRKKQLDDHADVLEKRQASIVSYEKQVNDSASTRHAELAARESALASREREQAERIAKAKADTAAIETMKADLEKRLDILRAIAGVAPVAHVLNADTGKLGATFNGDV